MKYLEERKVLIRAIQQMHQIGLIYLKSGNLSVRTPDNYVLIKPSGCSYEEIREEDLSLVNLRGEQVYGKLPPSSETPMHTMIYKAFPEVNAVVHTHSPYAIICSITGTEIPVFCNESLEVGGKIPVSEYGLPGTMEIGNRVIEVLKGPPAVKAAILKNHGAIVIGADMDEACRLAQLIEKLCMIYTKAKALGPVTTITDAQVKEIKEIYIKKGMQ